MAGIERIHRLSRKKTRDPDRASLNVWGFGTKKRMINCYKRKGTGVSIREGFSRRVQLISKKLWHRTKTNKLNSQKVSLTFDEPKNNGQVFFWERRQECCSPFVRDLPNESRRTIKNHKAPKLIVMTLYARSFVDNTNNLEGLVLEWDPRIASITDTGLSPPST